MKRALAFSLICAVALQAGVAAAGQIDLMDYGHIQDGMSEAEVLIRLGPPDRESFEGYTANNLLKKSFFYFSEPERYQNITTVITFIGGRVFHKERIYSHK
jgi:hypothetical protein